MKLYLLKMIIPWQGKTFHMDKDFVDNLKNYVDGVMGKNTSAVFLIDGKSGLGKTTFSSQIGCCIAGLVAEWKTKHNKKGKIYKPKFSLNDMTWVPDDFIDSIKQNTEPGDIRIMDESMIISNRSTMSEINRMIIIMMSMIRSKQLFIMFNVNSIFDLDKNLPLHRADMLCHTYAEDDRFASRGRYCVIPSAKGRLKNLYMYGKKYYDYSKMKYVIRDNFPSFFPFSWKIYDGRKNKAIEEYFAARLTTSSRALESRNLCMKYMKDKFNMKAEKIGEIAHLSRATVFRALNKVPSFPS